MNNIPTKKNIKYISLLSLRFSLILVFLLGCLAFLFWKIAIINPQDEQEYQRLIADSESTKTNLAQNSSQARQERRAVQKDFLFNKDNKRLQMNLKADESDLVLDQQDFHARLIEHMKNVKCVMQEELFYQTVEGQDVEKLPDGRLFIRALNPEDPASYLDPSTPNLKPVQIVKKIEADQAEYHYKGDRFVAEKVKIARYLLAGHQLSDIDWQAKLLMNGTAGKVEFALQGEKKDFNFKAYQLKATFYETGKLKL